MGSVNGSNKIKAVLEWPAACDIFVYCGPESAFSYF